MRFHRYERFEFSDTPRKRAAFVRKQRAERAAYPLFAEEIAVAQISAEEEMAERRRRSFAQDQKDRRNRAEQWSRARKRLNAYPPDVRTVLLSYWQTCQWPGTPVYLLSMLHMYQTGRLTFNLM